jgi:hypothetical protein
MAMHLERYIAAYLVSARMTFVVDPISLGVSDEQT